MVEKGKHTPSDTEASVAGQDFAAQPPVALEEHPHQWPGAVKGEGKAQASGENLAEETIDTAIIEAALTPEFELVEEIEREGIGAAETFGEQGLEVAQQATLCCAEGLRKLSVRAASFSRDSLENGSAFVAELSRAGSIGGALQIQIDYARSAYIALLKHLLEMNALYWDLIQESAKLASKGPAKA